MVLYLANKNQSFGKGYPLLLAVYRHPTWQISSRVVWQGRIQYLKKHTFSLHMFLVVVYVYIQNWFKKISLSLSIYMHLFRHRCLCYSFIFMKTYTGPGAGQRKRAALIRTFLVGHSEPLCSWCWYSGSPLPISQAESVRRWGVQSRWWFQHVSSYNSSEKYAGQSTKLNGCSKPPPLTNQRGDDNEWFWMLDDQPSINCDWCPTNGFSFYPMVSKVPTSDQLVDKMVSKCF